MVGSTLALSVACTGGIPTSYVWTGCTGTGSTCFNSQTTPGDVTYSVVVNGAVNASRTITWRAGAQNFCASYSNVFEQLLPWGGAAIATRDGTAFDADQVRVFRFTAPAAPATYAISGAITVAEFDGPPTVRQITLSRSKCDFRALDATGLNGPYNIGYGTTASTYFNVGAPPASLVPGETYYVNIRNWDPNTNSISCGQAACQAIIEPSWPR